LALQKEGCHLREVKDLLLHEFRFDL